GRSTTLRSLSRSIVPSRARRGLRLAALAGGSSSSRRYRDGLATVLGLAASSRIALSRSTSGDRRLEGIVLKDRPSSTRTAGGRADGRSRIRQRPYDTP